MNLRSLINKSLVLSVFIIAGYFLARSLYHGSLIGIVCAVIAIGAWTLFLYKLSSMQSRENDEAVEATE